MAERGRTISPPISQLAVRRIRSQAHGIDARTSVWIVLSGPENQQGEIADARVERVYASRALATEYVEQMYETMNESHPGDVMWVEEWDVSTRLWEGVPGMENE